MRNPAYISKTDVQSTLDYMAAIHPDEGRPLGALIFLYMQPTFCFPGYIEKKIQDHIFQAESTQKGRHSNNSPIKTRVAVIHFGTVSLY